MTAYKRTPKELSYEELRERLLQSEPAKKANSSCSLEMQRERVKEVMRKKPRINGKGRVIADLLYRRRYFFAPPFCVFCLGECECDNL